MKIITEHPGARQVIKVLQVTDTHLFADSQGSLLGLNTEQSLQAVISRIRASRYAADLILATGDLVHDGTPAAYQRIFSHLGSFDRPVYCLPGNHDEARTLQNTLREGHIKYIEHACHGNWHFIFLDSTIAHSEGAHLTRTMLDALESHLQEAPDAHTLICLHHQPVPMGSHWLDTMAVDNPDAFFNITDRHQQVRGILWGHVHQQYDGMRNDVRLMSTPSTCIQFLPRSKDFALDPAPPGYRWLDLHPDGRIETAIVRIEAATGKVDMASNGY
ncbi:MAG TPA: 3',5'-cyclic-AMP phosphodiesterase [Gammaproteobacteria bacterium]|nr:3',5'-cyclic-AMP phosphodiesterase [Gammaproteobacteria bacterium]